MGSETACLLGCAFCLFLAPLILHGVGLFTPKWGSNSTCDAIGVIYSCCSGDDNKTCEKNVGNDLDPRVMGLHATAFGMMFLGVFCMCVESFCNKDDEDTGWCGLIGGCCLMLYPVAGLFSFIGCMIWVSKYSGSSLGYSFALSLTSACLVLILTFIVCCLICKAMKDDDDDSGAATGRSNPEFSGAVQEYGGGGGAAPESGGFFLFARKLNIKTLVHTVSGHD
ncbi:uncharacterized protein LOC128238505 isoform X2 [Mya arenaria]|uniref:uncharacterized protein LOC128238505 isoform X2 n=1 Tax=Mya arenaria TaxID=6604 RepID=UPI0022E8B59E|nr:uncharacterized protein LOC128238505 isoform X2 [Mya arenaria]